MYTVGQRVKTPDGYGSITRVGKGIVTVKLDSSGKEYVYSFQELDIE